MNATIIQRFEEIRWHDSKLVGLSVESSDASDVVTLSLLLLEENGKRLPAKIVFEGATYIVAKVDLEGKRVCSHHISEGICRQASELLTSLSQQNKYDDFSDFLHFEVELIPPGGTISVLANSFRIEG